VPHEAFTVADHEIAVCACVEAVPTAKAATTAPREAQRPSAARVCAMEEVAIIGVPFSLSNKAESA
jgi:hypothetical protein